MWMGGYVPLGYDVVDRKLVVNAAEAARIRKIFERFIAVGSVTILAKEYAARGERNKRGARIDKGFLYRVLSNRLYIGEACHKGTFYPGEHEGIISRELWDKAHAIMGESPRARAANTRNTTPALLKGLIFMESGAAMTPTAAKKGAKLYRYYTSMDLIKNRATTVPTGPQRLSAGMVEGVVVGEMRRMLRTPEVAARALEALRAEGLEPDEPAVVTALAGFDELWSSLFPAEQARIVQLAVQRVTVGGGGIAVDLRNHGVGAIVREMLTPAGKEVSA